MICGLIGVVHLRPMPGDPGYTGDDGFEGVFAHALRDAEALAEGGADGVIVENFGSSPFPKGTRGDRVPPHQVVTIARVAAACSQRFGLPVGVNCLRNDARAAVGVAAAAGLAFVRVNVHTGAYVTDQGLVEGEAADTLRYRRALGATGVALLADVLVKHAAPLAPLDPVTATKDCLLRGHADGVIVTGSATGAAIDKQTLEVVRGAAGEAPVFLGSGVTPTLAEGLAPLAHGAIVGTWVKERGDVNAPVCRERVRRLAGTLRGMFLTA